MITATAIADNVWLAEAVGTALLIILGCGVVAAVLLDQSKAQNSGWIVITWGWAIGVLIGAYAVARYTGAHLNPAVTLGLWASDGFSGDTPNHPIWQYLLGEFLGAFVGAVVVYLAYINHWRTTEDPGLKLAVFSTGPAIRNVGANLITEIVGTFVLVFGILSVGGDEALGKSGLTVLIVALLVLGIGLSLGGPTGYAINPARDLSPRIAHAVLPIPGKGTSDWEYAWIPVVGPIAGGIIAGLLYNLVYT